MFNISKQAAICVRDQETMAEGSISTWQRPAAYKMDQTASVSVSTASVRNGLMCVKGVGKTYHWSCRSSAHCLNKKLLIGSNRRT